MRIKERCLAKGRDFYSSKWYDLLRKNIFNTYSKRCMKCSSKKNLVVDHIKPRSRFPKLELYPDNLQILCWNCNVDKSNKYVKDFRTDDDFYNLERAFEENSIIKAYNYLYKYESGFIIPESENKDSRQLIRLLIKKNTKSTFGKTSRIKFITKPGKVSKVKTIPRNENITLSIQDQVRLISNIITK